MTSGRSATTGSRYGDTRRLKRTRSPLVSPGSGQNTLWRLPTGTWLPSGSARTPRFRLDSSARNWSQSASMAESGASGGGETVVDPAREVRDDPRAVLPRAERARGGTAAAVPAGDDPAARVRMGSAAGPGRRRPGSVARTRRDGGGAGSGSVGSGSAGGRRPGSATRTGRAGGRAGRRRPGSATCTGRAGGDRPRRGRLEGASRAVVLAPHVPWRDVRPHPQVHGMTQHLVGRPPGELHLDDEARLDPMGRLVGGRYSRERRFGGGDGVQVGGDGVEVRLAEARPHVPGVDQPVRPAPRPRRRCASSVPRASGAPQA